MYHNSALIATKKRPLRFLTRAFPEKEFCFMSYSASNPSIHASIFYHNSH
nr:MAG TPA: hypothetical protein [Bacteriophage sp.]